MISIQERKELINNKMNELINVNVDSEKYSDLMNELMLLTSYKDIFDEGINNDKVYEYEKILSKIDKYVEECSGVKIKDDLQKNILIPNMLKFEQGYINSDIKEMHIEGMHLTEKYCDTKENNTQEVILNELRYALSENDTEYAKYIKKMYQRNEIDNEKLQEDLYKIYVNENENEAIEIASLIYVNGSNDEYFQNLMLKFEERKRKEKKNEENEKIENKEEIAEKKIKRNETEVEKVKAKEVKEREDKPRKSKEKSQAVEESDKFEKKELINERKKLERNFSRDHKEDIYNLIIAMMNGKNDIQDLSKILDEFPGNNNLADRVYQLYCQNSNSATKIMIELYQQGNGKEEVSKLLKSAKSATLTKTRESNVEKSRDILNQRLEKMKFEFKDIKGEMDYKLKHGISRYELEDVIEDLSALENRMVSTNEIYGNKGNDELKEIREYIKYAKYVEKQIQEMERITEDD